MRAQHTHRTHVDGCFRCDLSADEVRKAVEPYMDERQHGLLVDHAIADDIMAIVQPPLFGVAQTQATSDDYYTPAWVFERMAITFDLDVCAPPSGIPWIPAAKFYTKADDGLSAPWVGRVWMNPPYSEVTPWVERFIAHANGVCFVPFARSKWTNRMWDTAHAMVIPENVGSFRFANDRTVSYPVYLAAFGDECVDAISRLGVVRVRK